MKTVASRLGRSFVKSRLSLTKQHGTCCTVEHSRFTLHKHTVLSRSLLVLDDKELRGFTVGATPLTVMSIFCQQRKPLILEEVLFVFVSSFLSIAIQSPKFFSSSSKTHFQKVKNNGTTPRWWKTTNSVQQREGEQDDSWLITFISLFLLLVFLSSYSASFFFKISNQTAE